MLDDDAQSGVLKCPAGLALTPTELHVLDRLQTGPPTKQKTLSHHLAKIVKLGGYLARGSDPPPGNLVMWRGLSRLREHQARRKYRSTMWVIERLTGRIPRSGASVRVIIPTTNSRRSAIGQVPPFGRRPLNTGGSSVAPGRFAPMVVIPGRRVYA